MPQTPSTDPNWVRALIRGRLLDARDFITVALTIPRVEFLRRRVGPALAVPRLRRSGREAPIRTPAQRARLQRIIAVVDARMLGGGNCYRRVLLETALDRSAAAEPLHVGIYAHGTLGSGHAWLGDRRGSDERYDMEIVL